MYGSQVTMPFLGRLCPFAKGFARMTAWTEYFSGSGTFLHINTTPQEFGGIERLPPHNLGLCLGSAQV